jgi:endonuclease/exonuclease/phosphatase family metal-dependent hydrolase
VLLPWRREPSRRGAVQAYALSVFRLGTFNVRDLFDDNQPFVIGGLDRDGFGQWAQRRAKALYARKLESVAAMVQRMDADIIAFQEIEGAHVLDALRSHLGEGNDFHPAVAGRQDNRGIACGVLSRFPITSVEVHGAGELSFPVFAEGDPRPFAGRLESRRGVLEVTVSLPDATTLVLMVVHLKSPHQLPRTDGHGATQDEDGHYSAAEGAVRATVIRLAEALHLRSRVEARLMRDARAQIVVLGDFNDGPDSLPVRAVAGELAEAPRGRSADIDVASSLDAGVLHQCMKAVPAGTRYTILHRGAGQQVDHILVSRTLWRRFRSARVLNEELRETATDGREETESDHAPVVASFV